MRTQQQAEREEQQRIKNLVLNYDLTDDQQDGEEPSFHYIQTSSKNRTLLVGKGKLNESLPTRGNRGGQAQHQAASRAAHPPQQQPNAGGDKRRESQDSGYSSPPARLPAFAQPSFATPSTNKPPTQHADETEGTFENHPQIQPSRLDKSGNTRSKQRSRKLQLGDIDWYGRRSTTAPVPPNQPASQISLDSYVVDKSRSGRGRGNRQGSQIEGQGQRTASGGLQQGKHERKDE
jgi:regulator of nonsense transcripts 2